MDYHLDRDTRLIKETDHPSLYKWALQEFTKEGEPASSQLIPWAWRFTFSADYLIYVNSIDIDSQTKDDGKRSDSECLQAKLTAIGSRGLDFQSYSRFSMFGTNREVKGIYLSIMRLLEGQHEEHCQAWGLISSTYEFDFRDQTDDDQLSFQVFLKPENFEKLCALAQNKSIDDSMMFSVCGVDGFYSEWSPSISTDSVKLLTIDHIITNLENPNDLPKLGNVAEFRLQFARRVSLLPYQKDLYLKSEDSNATSEDVDTQDGKPDEENLNTNRHDELLFYLKQHQNILSKLIIPAWLMVVALIASIFIHR